MLAKPEHEVAYNDLIQLLREHAEKVTSVEMLAIASNMLGKLVAMQDQRMITPSIAMEIVVKNMEEGNKQVIENLRLKSEGNA